MRTLTRSIIRRCSTALKKETETSRKRTIEFKHEIPKETSFCNVALIGAESKLGELTAFLLAQNPLITNLHLQGGSDIIGLKQDLSDIDTRCRIVAHAGTDNYRNALKTANLIVLLGKGDFSKQTSIGDRIMQEGNRICQLAHKCTKYARRAVIVVCATPVSVMTKLVADIFRRTHWYHPGRIIGFPGPVSVVLNTEVGKHQSFDPNVVDVPIVGGPDLESIVPVFSNATPCPVDKESAVELTARLRGIEPEDFPKRANPVDTFVTAVYPEAVALNRLISAIAYGLHGDELAVGYAHVRTNLLQTCRFMVSQVRFGRNGVAHNYGLPAMSEFEQNLLQRGVAAVGDKEKMADEYLEYYLSNRKDCLPNFKQIEVEEYLEKRKASRGCG